MMDKREAERLDRNIIQAREAMKPIDAIIAQMIMAAPVPPLRINSDGSTESQAMPEEIQRLIAKREELFRFALSNCGLRISGVT